MNERTAHELWQDYRFLTKEMLKFIKRNNMDLFYDLLNQRQRLQEMIEQAAGDDFRTSVAGQSLYEDIRQLDLEVQHHLQVRMKDVKNHHQVTEAYKNTGNISVRRKSWER